MEGDRKRPARQILLLDSARATGGGARSSQLGTSVRRNLPRGPPERGLVLMDDWRWFYRARLRLRTLVRRSQVERELDEEFRYHLDQRIEHEIARGVPPGEARRIAIRAMEG